jgi:hypothetical protein
VGDIVEMIVGIHISYLGMHDGRVGVVGTDCVSRTTLQFDVLKMTVALAFRA